ncbi:MAG TPA: hypothetical protein VMM93_07395 [Vicinamibacterales bacterium]|nr:hypothetical protein [Vicinamibacterales bacterium]
MLTVACLLVPAYAAAQTFGVAESAETIDRGTFKLRLSPIAIFGKNGEDSRFGLGALIGYGLTSQLDIEGGVAVFDGVTIAGANAEIWLVRNAPMDVSIIGGLHRRMGDQTRDLTGANLTFLASSDVERLEVFAAVDLAFLGLGNDSNFRTVHFVPGIEYRVRQDLDLVAGLGIALNDHARHYFTAGLAFYWR